MSGDDLLASKRRWADVGTIADVPSRDRLKPESPFVWPEPRVFEGLCAYEEEPPIRALAMRCRAVFGFVTALTSAGVTALQGWLRANSELNVSLILQVYPTSGTRQSDLERLRQTANDVTPRLQVHILPLQHVSDRGANALCFVDSASESMHLAIGSGEDIGLDQENSAPINMVCRADVALVEGFRRNFDYWWTKSGDIASPGTVTIPELVLPEGTDEAARHWTEYIERCLTPPTTEVSSVSTARVDIATGEVILVSATDGPIASPTEAIGLAKPDAMAARLARLYEKGRLVSVDKLTRIPPLDAPLDPGIFGDASEMQRGNVTRKVSMRVSVIDEKTLKDIDRRRQGLRGLLAKFTFGLADNMRWMPLTARSLFEAELNRMNDEGQKLIADLWKGDTRSFVLGKRDAVVADINAMHSELGRPGRVTEDVIERVIGSLVDRLTRARSANFMPKLSYSTISFDGTNRGLVSPWGQALSLLIDVATFPRKALTDRFFFSGLKIGEDDLIDAMNVADDVLCRDLRARGIKERCRAELDLLARIERASLNARERCELTCRLLDGDVTDAIETALKEKEPGEKETD